MKRARRRDSTTRRSGQRVGEDAHARGESTAARRPTLPPPPDSRALAVRSLAPPRSDRLDGDRSLARPRDGMRHSLLESDLASAQGKVKESSYLMYFKRSWVAKNDGNYSGPGSRYARAYMPMDYSVRVGVALKSGFHRRCVHSDRYS